MALVAPAPQIILDNDSAKSISALSLVQFVHYFGSLDTKEVLSKMGTNEEPEAANLGTQEAIGLRKAAESNKNSRNKENILTSTQSNKTTTSKSFQKTKALEIDSRPVSKLAHSPATLDRINWFRKAFSTRFSTWAYHPTPESETPKSPESKLTEPFPALQLTGVDTISTVSCNESPLTLRKRAASVLVRKSSPNVSSPNFRPTRSRSLAGLRLTAVFHSKDLLLGKELPLAPEEMKNSVFLPLNHEPSITDFPSIKDVEDLSNGKAQYSTLPAHWDNYKDDDFKSSNAPSPKPRTRWAEWRRCRRQELKGLKGKLKLSLALGKRRSKELRVRFFSEGVLKKGRTLLSTTNEIVADTIA